MRNESRMRTPRTLIFSLIASLVFLSGHNIIFSSVTHAATPIADAGSDKDGVKTSLLSGNVVLEGSVSSDNPDDTFAFEWYGPFGTATGESIIAQMPQGLYTVSLQAVGCPKSSGIDTAEVSIVPAFTITPRTKRGVVQFTWSHITGTDHYDIYRAEENEPFSFEKIAETTSTYSTYLDDAVVNETNYLYAVSAIDADGKETFSNIVAACPPESRATARLNRPPLIYSPAVTTGNVGFIYEYTVLAADANNDALSYGLAQAPSDMTIDADTGKIQWTPTSVETVQVMVYVSDGNGLEENQTFYIEVTAQEPMVEMNVEPDSITPGQVGEDSSVLSWCAMHADYCLIEPRIGEVEPSGSMEVAPGETTEYTITAYGPGGTAVDVEILSVHSLSPAVAIIANPQSIFVGEETRLYWQSMNAETVNIDQGIGAVALGSGDEPDECRIVFPEVDTTYTVTAIGPEGTATDSVTVQVNPIPPPSVDLFAVEEEIARGEGSWLYWTSMYTETVTIDQGIGMVSLNGCYGGDVEGYTGFVSGECGDGVQVTPETTITYTITATGPGGTATDSVTVTVAEPLPTVSVVAASESIDSGDSTWLYWHSSNADTVTIDQNVGTVAANGCYGGEDEGYWDGVENDCGFGEMVSPQTTTTYTITATGPGGTVTDSVTITVSDPPAPTVTLVASTETIESGGQSWLFWRSTNAEFVSINQGVGVVGENGCYSSGNGEESFPLGNEEECGEGVPVIPLSSTTYTITAMGPGGIATDSVTINVTKAPPTVDITADETDINPGGTTCLQWHSTHATIVEIDQGIGVVALNSCVDVPITPACIPGEIFKQLNRFFMPSALAQEHSDTECQEKIAVSPLVTTTYTITAIGPGGTVTDSVTVHVGGESPPTVEISADETEIESGDTTWLQWHSTNATIVEIDQGIGVVAMNSCVDLPVTPASISDSIFEKLNRFFAPTALAQEGSNTECQEKIAVSPLVTTTYTITATGPGGATTSSVTVIVDGQGVPTADFFAEPSYIYLGRSTTLHWETNNAGTVSIDQGIGEVSPDSDEAGLLVSPETTTTYSLTATGAAGQGSVSITVIVLDPLPPLVDLIAWPETVRLGEDASLAWSSSDAEIVIIEADVGNDIGEVELNSGMEGISVVPTTTTTYTITAIGPGGTVTDSVTVNVLPYIEIDACNQPVTAGESCLMTITTVNGESVSIDQGIGDVEMSAVAAGEAVTDFFEYESRGSAEATPLEETIYTVTATGTGGTSTKNVTMGVVPYVDFYVDQDIIEIGEPANLHWATLQADTVFLDPGLGEVAENSDPEGFAVHPHETMTYTLNVEGPTRTVLRSVRIHVNDFSKSPEITTFEASPSTIDPGETAVLTWETVNMLEARIDNGVGDIPMFGSFEVSPDRTTTYTLVAKGPRELTTEQVTVYVQGTWESGGFGDRYGDLIPNITEDEWNIVDEDRFSLLTGFCTDIYGNPMANVRISILEGPEFGETFTDVQGRYSLPVEGNNRYTVVMAGDGYLPVHRRVDVVNNRIEVVDTAVLIKPDTVSTLIDFSEDAQAVLFHGGEYVSDESGRRRLTMTIPYSDAFAVPGDITTTEYPMAVLPAPLPPNTSLVFASEIGISRDSVDTGLVSFNEPAVAWVENFLNFSVGQRVPVGWYDRDLGMWIPRENGLVVRLLDEDGDGEVDGVDMDGDASADDLNGDGDTADETTGLLSEGMEIGATYYRFAVDKTGPWVLSWPYASMDAPPPMPDQAYDDLDAWDSEECTLARQNIAIPGTELFLQYSEARVSGYQPVVTIPVTGESVSADVESVVVRMIVAGQIFEQILPPDPEQTVQFQWDGRDYLGNEIEGTTVADIRIGYLYKRNYATAGAFGHAFSKSGIGDTGIPGREAFIAWHRERIEIDRLTRSEDFFAAGWTLSAQHLARSSGPATLYLGDGGMLSFENELIANDILKTRNREIIGPYGIIGRFDDFSGIAVDESSEEIYIGDNIFDVVWANPIDYPYDILEDQIDILGDQAIWYSGPIDMPFEFAGDYLRLDPEETLNNPMGVAVDDSGVYYAESGSHVIRKGWYGTGRYGIFAGTGQEGYSGDGQSALNAQFSFPTQIALDYWGNLYIVDRGNSVIRKISPDGIVETIAGNGTRGSDGDGGLAPAASINPSDIAVDAWGNIFIAEPAYHKIRMIDVSGIITTVAGTGMSGGSGIGGPASLADLDYPVSVSVDSFGTLFIGDYSLKEVGTDDILKRRVFLGDEAAVNTGVMTTDIQGQLFLNNVGDGSVLQARRPIFSDLMNEDYYKFANPNGQVYYFSDLGKHLYTGSPDAPAYSFIYDLNNLLVAVLDADGDTILTINRDADGKVETLESSEGITTLVVEDNNHLVELIAPDDSSADMTYSNDGVLTDFSSTFSSSSGSVQGIVTANDTGESLEGITVNLTGPEGTVSLLTAADGSYTFSNLDPGEYTLEFSHTDYLSHTLACEVAFGDCHLTRNVEMQMLNYPPEVLSFEVSPEVVEPGDQVTVSWETQNATYVMLTDEYFSFYERMGPNGLFQETFNKAKRYIIQAFNPVGKSDKYYILAAESSFWGNINVVPNMIAVGESATISWESIGADFIDIDGVDCDASGSMVVSPEETTTYILHVEDDLYNIKSYSTTLTVVCPPEVEIQASPDTILVGESATLTWNSVRSETVTIDNGIGEVSPSGSIQVTPEVTTTYTITATSLEGTATANVTLSVVPPSPTVQINAVPESIVSGESSTLSWSSEYADTCTIEPNIGDVDTTGSLAVYPTETTTYTITAIGQGDFATNETTVMVISPISLVITSPLNGDVIDRPDVMVQGTFSNTTGSITGITVNGVLALAYEDEFIANHVPLQEGDNTLTVTATDTEGNSLSVSAVVTMVATGDYIRILAIPESGVFQLETSLKIDGSFSITESSVSGYGPGDVEFLESSAEEYAISISEPGMYYFTAEIEEDAVVYTDAVAVSVVDQTELDAQLQNVFSDLKMALADGNIEAAVNTFTIRSRDRYHEAFEELADSLQQIAVDMEEGIELIYVYDDIAKYRIHRSEEISGEMIDITYYIYFRIDTDGLWKMDQL